MYMNSAREAFERAKMRSYGIPDLPAWPGDGSTECLTNCRCSWRFVVVYGGIECYWEIDWDAENCQDCIDRHYMWNPYFAKAETKLPPVAPPTRMIRQTHRAKLAAQPYSDMLDAYMLGARLGVLLDSFPDRHLEKINDILATRPPVDFMWLMDEGCWAELIPGIGPTGCYTGLYHTGSDVVYIHPDHLLSGTTLVREIAFSLVQAWALNVFTPNILVPLFQYGAPGHNWVAMGLRARSFVNAYEFATDAYQVWRSGTDTQFAVLSSMLLEQGVNLEGLFGARL